MRGGGIGGFLPISIYFILGRKLSVVSSSVLYMYIAVISPYSLKIPLSFVAGQSLNLK